MNELTLWECDKKKRTMIRYIKPGDIFCFQYNESTYCFGRILSRLDIGTPSEYNQSTSGVIISIAKVPLWKIPYRDLWSQVVRSQNKTRDISDANGSRE